MVIQLFNSMTNTKQEFIPSHPPRVTMYNCGPTVYNTPHIGNMRSFLFSDLLKRYLAYRGFNVHQVMNITDVGHMTSDADQGEDKMEKAARTQQLDPWTIADKYTDVFMKHLALLNISKAQHYPRATQHIQEMILIINKLIEQDVAYVVDGNVYYDTTKAPDYGKLSGNTLDKLKKQQRATDDTNKRNPQDFVLWFSNSKYKNHIMKWPSPWGEGYPGWHIECSAMSMRYLSDAFDGNQFYPQRFTPLDIHTGGEDNKFPHHECEIAQSEAATGKQFAKYWLHVRHLLVEGEKMSKSLGNFYTLDDLTQQGHSPKAIRYAMIATHYRSQMNFTQTGVQAAQKVIDRFNDTIQGLYQAKGTQPHTIDIPKARQSFIDQMDDDLNISGALGVVHDTLRAINAQLVHIDTNSAHECIELLKEWDGILGVMDFSQTTDHAIEALILQRDQARKNKNWDESDKIRDTLTEMGIEVFDTPQGTRWRKTSQ